nr:hypothetical protein [Salmonella bongori serovar 66:z65:-]
MNAVNDAPPTMVVTLSILSVLKTIAGITRYVNPYRRCMAAQIQHKQLPAAIMDIAPGTLK